MQTEQAPPPLPAAQNPPTSGSVVARMLNVPAAPGDVFASIKDAPHCVGNWLVPVLLACVVGVASVWAVFSQDVIVHQLREQTDRAMDKKLKDVPKEQQEQVRQTTEKFMGPEMLKILGSAGVVFGSFAWLFLLSLIAWGLARLVFKADCSYTKMMEMCGLAGMVGLIGGVVSTLLVVSLGNLQATPSPALLIREFDPANAMHLAAASLNVFTIWYTAVLSIGLAKLSGGAVWKCAAWLFGLWLLAKAIGIGWAVLAARM